MLLGGTVGVALEEAVMRVGYKDEMVFLFLPDEDGVYKVWRTGSSTWSDSELAKDARTYVLIDPPEAAGAVYKDSPRCHVIKYASNNAAKHYKNWEKDGMLLVTAMPSEAEVLVMTPILWTERTAFPGQSHDTAEAKVQEIKDRCDLTGYTIRNPFDHALFKGHLLKIAQESQTVGMEANLNHLRCLHDGTMTSVEGAEGEASSVSSKLYLIGPSEDDRATAFVKLNPMAKFMTQAVLGKAVSDLGFKAAFTFEEYCKHLLCQGGEAGGTTLTARAQVIPENTWVDTSTCILSLPDEKNEFVVASTGNTVHH
jgi:hypothetical protein